jgi:hypothetical protein
MEPLVNPKVQTSKLTDLVKNLSNSLSSLKTDNSETTKIITYALIATAVVGIMVYQYIKEQEQF